MGEVPSTQNKWADLIDGLIDALMKGGLVAGEAFLTVEAPAIMAVPFLSWLIKQFLSWLDSFISKVSQRAATNMVIDIQTRGEESKVLVTATALQLALASGTEEDQKYAIENASNAYASLIHWDGSRPPSS